MKQEKDRGRIGRGDGRADQQPLDPAAPQRQGRDEPGDRRREDDAERRQRQGRGKREAKARAMRADAAIEQDQAERRATDQIGGPDVVEGNAAPPLAKGDATQAFLADDHAEGKEDEQHRRPDPAGEPAGENAGEQQDARKQQPSMREIHL